MSDVIKNFCKDGDTHKLTNLSREIAVLFQKLCVIALKRDNTNHKIARQVLEYYGLDDQGEKILSKKPPRKKVVDLITKMSVALTGARVGDVLSGASKGSKGAILKIHAHDIPPTRRVLDGVRSYPDLWHQFLTKLSAIPYFTEMSLRGREIWLLVNEASNDNSIGEEGSRIEVLQPGVGDLSSKLNEEQMNNLINGNPYSEDGYWSYKEIENMIPGKPGTKARRHTLILIRSFWRITTSYKVLEKCNIPTIRVSEGLLVSKGIEIRKEEIFLLNSITRRVKKKGSKWVRPSGIDSVQKLGIQVNKGRVDLTSLKKVASDSKICFAYREFTGASYKSLIQKLIRFRPRLLDIGDGELVPAEDALYVAMRSLAEHPGAFIPDIQRFVSGMESLTKRLGVIITEDSMVPLNQVPTILLSLLSGSLLCQRVRGWLPCKKLLDKWFQYGKDALSSLEAVDIDVLNETTKKPYVLTLGQPTLHTASALMDELRSFPIDLRRYRAWALHYPKLDVVRGISFPDVMPLAHCVDQHWAPGVIHYFTPSFVEKITSGRTTSAPFQKLFEFIWDKSSSINPRRTNLNWKKFEQQPDIIEIRNAQKLYLVAKQQDHYPREKVVSTSQFTLEYTLKDSWLTGMLGAVEVKANRNLKHPAMLVTLDIDNPLNLLAVRRPSRNMTEDPLSDEAKEYAIQLVKSRLKIGISLNKAKAPATALEDCILILKEDDEGEYYYVIKQPKKYIPIRWKELKHLTIQLPFLEELKDWSIAKALRATSIGVEENAEQKLIKLVKETSTEVVRHALIYLSTFSSTIEMHRVSRDGGGTYKAVSIYDVGAYQFMLKLSSIYPAALAPSLHQPSAFTIPIGPLLWTIRERISKQLNKGKTGDKGWQKIKFKDTRRKLWKHQQQMVHAMIKNRESGDKGNFIWSTVGLGKCLHPNTPVLMWDGSVKKAKEIIEGDLLIGDNDQSRKVLSTCTGEENMYKIIQTNGDDYIVNEPHILTLCYDEHKTWSWDNQLNEYRLRWFDPKLYIVHQQCFKVSHDEQTGYTKEKAYQLMMKCYHKIHDNNIVDISILDYLRLPLDIQKGLKGFKVGVNFPYTPVDIDPYYLGIWLSNVDNNNELDEGSDLYKNLKKNNLLKNKHIPKEYLKNDRKTRLQLLAGFFDTIGNFCDGKYVITHKSLQLAKNICYLCRSLGFDTKYKHICKHLNSVYKCYFSGDARIREVPCKKKKLNQNLVEAPLVTNITIQKIGKGHYCGFTLDGNGRFLLGDFTVTHNTASVLTYLQYLKENDKLSRYIVYTLPQSAIKSIIEEIKYFDIPMNLIIPLKDNRKHAAKYENLQISKSCTLLPHTINLIEHDHLRRCTNTLLEYAARSFFIVDEVHKTLNDTLRTSIALEIAQLSKDFVVLTGTPVIDNDTHKLIGWLEQVVPFEVNRRNFWAAATAMIAKSVNTGIEIENKDIVAEFTKNEYKEYLQLVPPALGGSNTNPRYEDWLKATNICYHACDREMVNSTLGLLERGVMLVAKDANHQQRLYTMLLENIKPKDIFLMKSGDSIFLTEEAVATGKIHGYKVVIVPQRKAEGYTLTYLSAMITSVYPSNNATREQLRGRINRISQKRSKVLYRTIHVGLLTSILHNHNSAKNLSIALKGLARQIKM